MATVTVPRALLAGALLAFVAARCTVASPNPVATNAIVEAVNPRDGAVVCLVPSGDVTLGANVPLDIVHPEDHLKPFSVSLSGFWICKHEVTVGQFGRFIKAIGRQRQRRSEAFEKNDWPVTFVTWEDAQAYCEWAGGSLPSEVQWEAAARGADQRLYPWGDRFDIRLAYCNSTPRQNTVRVRLPPPHKDGLNTATYTCPVPVDTYPQGASPYGALHMAGNVAEWCLDSFNPAFVPRGRDPVCQQSPPLYKGYHVEKGSSYGNNEPVRALLAPRRVPALGATPLTGFRCVLPEAAIPRPRNR